jgi:hypothetical protein
MIIAKESISKPQNINIILAYPNYLKQKYDYISKAFTLETSSEIVMLAYLLFKIAI